MASISSSTSGIGGSAAIIQQSVISARLHNASIASCRLAPETIVRICELVKDKIGWPTRPRGRYEPMYEKRALGVTRPGALGWVVLTQICVCWRNIVLNTPRLWTDPEDYFALLPSQRTLVLETSRNLPLTLNVCGETFGDHDVPVTQQTIARYRLPSPFTRIQELYISGFSARQLRCFEPYFQTAPQSLRSLYVMIRLRDDEDVFVLCPQLCSGDTIATLSLYNCFPSRWDSPFFGPRLTSLALTCDVDHPIGPRPTPYQFADILSRTVSLETLELADVFPTATLDNVYPPMIFPATFRSMSVGNMEGYARRRECLLFLAHLVLNHGIHCDIFLGDSPSSDPADDADIALFPSTLIADAIRNIYHHQGLPTQLILGEKAFLTHNSHTSRAPECACPIISEYDMYADAIPGATSIIAFNFNLAAIPDPSSWHDGAIEIPLEGLRSISFDDEGADAYLDSVIWRDAFEDAEEVHHLSTYISDCASLLPLAERVLVDDVAIFPIFPHLQTLHIYAGESELLHASGPAHNGLSWAQREADLSALRVIVRTRTENNAGLQSIVVDEALRAWPIWEDLRHDVEVEFRVFDPDHRSDKGTSL